ncbi:MAG TPA: response regulator transcription factor [Roseiflexaceae bacterium]|nr:response regulator transcription factor [Roseiflexaceae bacterium]
MRLIRVLLADDHALVRAGIRALLQHIPGVEVVAEADDARQALAQIAADPPDVVLMDIAMPGMSGLEATAHISREFPGVHIIILSMHASEEYVRQALRAGAAGYLLKESRTPELQLAVEAVARGETYLSPAVSAHAATRSTRTWCASTCSARSASAPACVRRPSARSSRSSSSTSRRSATRSSTITCSRSA